MNFPKSYSSKHLSSPWPKGPTYYEKIIKYVFFVFPNVPQYSRPALSSLSCAFRRNKLLRELKWEFIAKAGSSEAKANFWFHRKCICVFVYMCVCVFVYLSVSVYMHLCVCVFLLKWKFIVKAKSSVAKANFWFNRKFFCFCVYMCICVFVYLCCFFVEVRIYSDGQLVGKSFQSFDSIETTVSTLKCQSLTFQRRHPVICSLITFQHIYNKPLAFSFYSFFALVIERHFDSFAYGWQCNFFFVPLWNTCQVIQEE